MSNIIKKYDLSEITNYNKDIKHLYDVLEILGFKTSINSGPWIAGGSVSKMVTGKDLGSSDIDIFLSDSDGGSKKNSSFSNKMKVRLELLNLLSKNNFNKVRESRFAVTYEKNNQLYQIINKSYSDLYTLLADFDFTISKAVYAENSVFLHRDFFKHHDQKILQLDIVNYCSHTNTTLKIEKNMGYRALKFLNQGFIPDKETFNHILLSSNLPLETAEWY